jgi:hypothetical protein
MHWTRRPPTDAELVELHDRLWNDPRRRDDRTEFHECDGCGRAVRWIVNLGSATGGSIPIVARPVGSAASFDPVAHAGLVAVWPDRTGFTIPRAIEPDELEHALLYRCHWDACDHARVVRDRLGRHRTRRVEHADAHGELDPQLLDRYAAWRSNADRG